MSPELEQQIIERLKADHAKASRDAKLLRIELESIGENFIHLGHDLIDHPLTFTFAHDGSNPMLSTIEKHIEDLREAETTAHRAKGQLAALGIFVE